MKQFFSFLIILTIVSCSGNNSGADDPYDSEYGNHVEKSTSASNDLNASGTYTENLLGTKLKIDGYIENYSSSKAYKNIEIRIDFYGKNDEFLGSEFQTVYETVNPGAKKTFKMKVDNYSNVGSIGWDVIDAELY